MSPEVRPAVTWKMAFDRQLVWRRGGSVRYLVVEIRAADAGPRTGRQREPLNIALVIDASGSMTGLPLECAKAAAAGVVERLCADDRVAITSFADDSIVHFEGLSMDDAGKARAVGLLDTLQTRGCTDLAAGWLEGCECTARVMARQGVARGRVVLLSDGHANRGQQEPGQLAAIADALRMRGVYTSTVGIGDGYSPVQLEAIAEHGGGRMHDAERPEEIIEVVLGELGEAAATVADDIQLQLRCPAGTECRCLGSWPASEAGEGLTISAGALTGGAMRRIVFQITAPAGRVGETLTFNARLCWRSEGGAKNSDAPQSAALTWAGGEANSGQPRDEAIGLIAAGAWQNAIVRRITEWNRDGEFQRSKEYLREQSRWFNAYCEGLPGAETLVEQLRQVRRHAGHAWSERARKEIRLQHHKMSRMESDHRAQVRPDWNQFLE